MSNEYKDWFDDRAHEAWEDLTKIAEIVDSDNPSLTYQEAWYKIESILKEGGWI